MTERISIDETSLLVETDGESTIGEVESAIASRGLTLAIAAHVSRDLRIGAWIDEGLVGARDPWSDPADHTLAGILVTLANGSRLTIAPRPRRSVGPDLIALFVGTRARFGNVTRAWLRIHRVDEVRAPRVASLDVDLCAAPSEVEARLYDAIDSEIRSIR